MSFMQPEIYRGNYYAVETREGTYYVPSWLVGDAATLEDVRDYCPATPTSMERATGVLARLSAPGYLDSTDWTPYDSSMADEDIEKDINDTYGNDDEEDLE